MYITHFRKREQLALFTCQLFDLLKLQSQIPPLCEKNNNVKLSSLRSHLWCQAGEAGGWVITWYEGEGQARLTIRWDAHAYRVHISVVIDCTEH